MQLTQRKSYALGVLGLLAFVMLALGQSAYADSDYDRNEKLRLPGASLDESFI